MSVRPPVERISWILNQLRRRHRLRSRDIAERFGTSVRTAFRDLQYLRERMHIALEFDRDRNSFVLNERVDAAPPFELTRGELLALFFTEKVLHQYRGTPFETELTAAFSELQQYLPGTIRVAPTTLSDFAHVDLGPLATPELGAFRTIVDALIRRRKIRVRYANGATPRPAARRLGPIRVYNVRGDWYLAARDFGTGRICDVALHRLRDVRVTEEPFAPDADFDLDQHLREVASGTTDPDHAIRVSVRFSPRQARWITDKEWHSQTRIQRLRDGGCVLSTPAANLSEFKRWVMQYGDDAEVLRPASLRREIASELRRMARSYAGRGGRHADATQRLAAAS